MKGADETRHNLGGKGMLKLNVPESQTFTVTQQKLSWGGDSAVYFKVMLLNILASLPWFLDFFFQYAEDFNSI